MDTNSEFYNGVQMKVVYALIEGVMHKREKFRFVDLKKYLYCHLTFHFLQYAACVKMPN